MSISARDRWTRITGIPLAAMGVLFVVGYSWWVLADRDDELAGVPLLIFGGLWAVFTVDVVVRLVLTPRGGRASYAWHNPLDLLALIMPVFRALHSVSLLQRVQFFQGRGGTAMRARTIAFLLAYAIVYVWFLAILTLHVERSAPGSTITSFGDAIWWACVTVFTVGYGDVVPVTLVGRLNAVLLMMGGVAIIAVVSAVVVSFLTERIRHTHTAPEPVQAAGLAEPGQARPAGPAASSVDPPSPSDA